MKNSILVFKSQNRFTFVSKSCVHRHSPSSDFDVPSSWDLVAVTVIVLMATVHLLVVCRCDRADGDSTLTGTVCRRDRADGDITLTGTVCRCDRVDGDSTLTGCLSL